MNKKRLLVVDDELAFGEFVRKIAVSLGYKVRVTLNGRDFQNAYHKFKPTTIVLDIVMPDMDGIEVLQWLAEQRCEAAVIITTGYSPLYIDDARTLAEYQGLRSVDTLTKPIRAADLRTVLTKVGPS